MSVQLRLWYLLGPSTSCQYTVTALRGHNNGTFAAPTFVNDVAITLAIGDYNADGWLDVATSSGGSSVIILNGQNNGTLGTRTPYLMVNAVSALVAADYNHDNSVDIAVTSLYTREITTMMRSGCGL